MRKVATNSGDRYVEVFSCVEPRRQPAVVPRRLISWPVFEPSRTWRQLA